MSRLFACFVILGPILCPGRVASQSEPYWQHTNDPVAVECQPSLVHVNWQWRENAVQGDLREESPLNALSAYSTPDQFFTLLRKGQEQNEQARGLYSACLNAYGSRYMCYLVASASEAGCDVNEAKADIGWLYKQEPGFIVDQWTASQKAFAAPKVRDQDELLIRVLVQLLYRQRHNADALSNFRACFKNSPTGFFAILKFVIQ